MLFEILGWTLISFGLLTLTEGLPRLPSAGRELSPMQFWWLAGLISAAGLGLIIAGLAVKAW